jgi:ABC-type sugar transport system permease subunit
MMAPALFAALVVTQAFADGRDWAVGADTAGVVVAAVAAWRGVSVIAVVFLAAGTAAGLRLVF